MRRASLPKITLPSQTRAEISPAINNWSKPTLSPVRSWIPSSRWWLNPPVRLKADQAAVASAQLQLDWTRITAPIDGRVGLKQVDIGNQISSGDTTGIVVLTQTHPIDLVFTPAGKRYRHRGTGAKGREKTLTVEARDRTNKQKISTGNLLSLDNQIDATTGTIKLKARFNNLDDALFPNQFVNARMLVDTEQDAVVIPTAALQMGNEGHFVWVLNSENKVSKHTVTPGIQDSQKVVINAGLSAGDRVVTDGIDRLTEGAKVEVVEAHSAVQEQPTTRPSGKKTERAPDASITPKAVRAALPGCLLCVRWRQRY